MKCCFRRDFFVKSIVYKLINGVNRRNCAVNWQIIDVV